MKGQRKIDHNVEMARCVAILSILLHHSIAVYLGWPPNSGAPIGLESWEILLSIMLKGIGLGLFALISGYLAFYSMSENSPMIVKVGRRSKRILIPMAVFGGGDFLLFPQMMNDGNPVMGTHLWFLPVIFMCYCSLLLSKSLQDRFCIPVWITSLCIWGFFVIQHYWMAIGVFSSMRTMWPVYILGFYFAANKDWLLSHLPRPSVMCFLFGLFVFNSSLYFYCPSGLGGSITELLNTFGVSPILFVAICLFWKCKMLPISLQCISKNSFQLYVLHQFVINAVLIIPATKDFIQHSSFQPFPILVIFL